MLVYRSTVAAAMVTGALLVGCTAPDQPTDLRTDGPPNVTTVLVMSDLRTSVDPSPSSLPRLFETATFCRVNDDKRPGLVGLPNFSARQICPEALTDAAPNAGAAQAVPPAGVMFVRVVFDKLLDPHVEDLVPVDPDEPSGPQKGTLAATQPVTLRCGPPGALVDVRYDGYYSPNGNSRTWPLGPALFIQPLPTEVIPVGATCEVTIKDTVHNKKGASVPTDQRVYTFKLADMALRFSSPDPEDDDPGVIAVDPASPVNFYWTAAVGELPTAAQVELFEAPNIDDPDDPDGAPDLTVCDEGGGTAVDVGTITPAVHPANLDDDDKPVASTPNTTDLIMDIGLTLPAPDDKLAWKPRTTYRLQFAPGTEVGAKQGGAAGTLDDYTLCFHTTAAAM